MRWVKQFLKCILINQIFVSVTFLVFAQDFKEEGRLVSQKYSTILIDLRNSRGGNGDVAAGYLTLLDLLNRYEISSKIYLLVDNESHVRLNSFIGVNRTLPKQVQVIREASEISSNERIELYLSMANPSGRLQHKSIEAIPISKRTPLLVQTTLGNTENTKSLNPYALLQIDNLKLEMNSAGIASNEAGIYGDPIAMNLRGKSIKQARDFIISEIDSISNESTQTQILDLINGNKLKNSNVGLVYGVTAQNVKEQFETYLEGLVNQSNKSFCLITPSKFVLSSISNSDLRSKVSVYTSESDLPRYAENNHIYILKTPNLPHSVFVGLTYYSMKQGVVPVGAGDGFFSAAIALGEPFVLTRVPWNADNINNLKKRLMEVGQLNSNLDLLLNQIFGEINLEGASRLLQWKSLFSQLYGRVSLLTDSIVTTLMGIEDIIDQKGVHLIQNRDLKRLKLRVQDEKSLAQRQRKMMEVSEKSQLLKNLFEDSSLDLKTMEILKNYYQTQNGAGNKVNKLKCSKLFI